LTQHLDRINDCAALRDALDATLFFSTSMGRIGADFQALLPPIFEPRLVDIIASYWDEGLSTLQKTLKICHDAGVASPLYNQTSVTDDEPHNHQTKAIDFKDTSGTPSPPRQLLSFPPLARIVNAYLTGLNELRRCLLPGVFPSLLQQLKNFNENVKQVLQANERVVLTPGMKGEAPKLREYAADMKQLYDTVIEPYFYLSLNVALGLHEESTAQVDKNDEDAGEETDSNDEVETNSIIKEENENLEAVTSNETEHEVNVVEEHEVNVVEENKELPPLVDQTIGSNP